ncbi:MAG: hypothetical protein AABY32_01175 [Nanoarchaeota archaeon]
MNLNFQSNKCVSCGEVNLPKHNECHKCGFDTVNGNIRKIGKIINGYSDDVNGVRGYVTYLLTDLHYFCKHENLDLNELVTEAASNFNMEIYSQNCK